MYTRVGLCLGTPKLRPAIMSNNPRMAAEELAALQACARKHLHPRELTPILPFCHAEGRQLHLSGNGFEEISGGNQNHLTPHDVFMAYEQTFKTPAGCALLSATWSIFIENARENVTDWLEECMEDVRDFFSGIFA